MHAGKLILDFVGAVNLLIADILFVECEADDE